MANIVSCIFSWNGLDRAAYGLLGAGERLARQMGLTHCVLVIGPAPDAVLGDLAKLADSVHVADHPSLATYHSEITLTALAEACRSLEPTVVLLANDSYSQELAPRLAHRLKGSVAGDATTVEAKNGSILVNRPVYGGKAQATIVLRQEPAIVWIRSRAQFPAESKTSTAEVHRVTLSLEPDERVRIVSQETEENKGEARLEEARFIVSGGRGLGGPEPFKQLQKLAAVMGAQMAASRAACDAGWVPPTWQVGQTGKKVAPELYLAIAVSGASQHLMGIADAKVVAAINTDRDAAIFNRCTFGLVEDYRKVVELLEKKISESRL